ncbi:hypothetical protein XAC3562_370036 [Xanthomonas citri pv. citri]|uniref:Uncharacterized protein n=1 Tax=Xanthomonas citri pv. citri TaxID=611301 RepID=A0A0U5FDI7_XANCI|nr:hypothetical protein XAC908_520036 [Xanthomonas citri pv. citri]CEG16423.1 hypothetical protein XAC3562_370036 [Xanthomonas citri pv. citri]CEH65916.1 hypothetical protein XACLD7_6390009 [Xanthomonas citri pv. citri]CEH67593.1 hypothetical protein XACLH37_1050017 [Xanthomonas citri pv. citri]CEJ23525.1 hypothetical protein XACE116_5300010 [Xanthomonas citri pv. citri]
MSVAFAGMKKGAEAPLFNDLQMPVEVCRSIFGAGNETRTRDLNLGKVALYQLSYSRVEQNCTAYYFVALALSSLSMAGIPHAMWRPGPELNRRTRICSPLHNHSTTRPKHQTQGILP